MPFDFCSDIIHLPYSPSTGHFQPWVRSRRLSVILCLSPFLRRSFCRWLLRRPLHLCSWTGWPSSPDSFWQSPEFVLVYRGGVDRITWLPYTALENSADYLQFPATSDLFDLHVSYTYKLRYHCFPVINLLMKKWSDCQIDSSRQFKSFAF